MRSDSQFATKLDLTTTGNPFSTQPSKPPSSGRTRVIPILFNESAARALEASFGHEQ